MTAIKTVQYDTEICGGEVAYVVFPDGTCVFTYFRLAWAGIDGIIRATSSINAVEEIVQAICRQEGMSLQELVFHDLQTCLGYIKKEGEFEFDRIKFSAVDGVSWRPMRCSQEVIELFGDYIGDNPRQEHCPV